MLVQESRNARHVVPTPGHADLVAQTSEHRLRELVEALSIPRNYFREPADNRRIARWIAEGLTALGLRTHLQGPYANVVAMTRAAAERPSVLIGAHYDSVARSPGADDNASAVAAMMHCAELLAHHDSELALCFVAFNCEENGLRGSADFAANFLPTSPLTIRLAHVLEMVGYCDHRSGSQTRPSGLPIRIPKTGDFLGLLANHRSRRAASRVLRLARSYLPDFRVLSLKVYFRLERKFPVLLRSDHASFWECGVPSLLWTDTSEFRNPHYHRASDTPETLDYGYLKRVTQLLAVAALSDAER